MLSASEYVDDYFVTMEETLRDGDVDHAKAIARKILAWCDGEGWNSWHSHYRDAANDTLDLPS